MRQDGTDDPAPSWPSTPTPTTRPCSPRGRWRAPPRRATGWSSSSPPTATLGLASDEFTSPTAASVSAVWPSCARAPEPWASPRVECLGYADSGHGPRRCPTRPGRVRFVRRRRRGGRRAAGRRSCARSDADVLLTYDRNGGYGHRDHVRVHEVGAAGRRARRHPARAAGDGPPRHHLPRRSRLAAQVLPLPAGVRPDGVQPRLQPPRPRSRTASTSAGMPRAKRASMRAHASQATADGGADRTLAAFLRIPRPLFDLVFGREWFVDPAPARGRRLATTSSRGWRERQPGDARTAPDEPHRRRRPRRSPDRCARSCRAWSGSAWPWPCSSGACRASPRRPGRGVARAAARCPCSTAVGLLALMRRRAVLLHLHAHRVAARPQPRQALIVNVCGSSVGNLLPGGGAAGVAATYAICRSWGFSPPGHLDLGDRQRRLEHPGPGGAAGHRHRRPALRCRRPAQGRRAAVGSQEPSWRCC